MSNTRKDALWATVQSTAVLDRESYLDAWSQTGDVEVIAQIQAEIERTKALRGTPFAQALDTDREGVRLAFLSAQCWFESLADSQVGREKVLANTMANRVTDFRLKMFGQTKLETAMENTVAVPLHLAAQILREQGATDDSSDPPGQQRP